MADIQLDLSDLRALWADMKAVTDEFGESDGVPSGLIDAIGHGGLTDRMHDFGSSWDEHRKSLDADMTTVWQGVKIVEEAYTELDLRFSQDLPDAVLRNLQAAPEEAS